MPQKLPTGWDDSRIQEVLAHYEGQTEDEQAAEIEAALTDDGVTMVAVPAEIADEVRALIARKKNVVPAAVPERDLVSNCIAIGK